MLYSGSLDARLGGGTADAGALKAPPQSGGAGSNPARAIHAEGWRSSGAYGPGTPFIWPVGFQPTSSRTRARSPPAATCRPRRDGVAQLAVTERPPIDRVPSHGFRY